MCVDWWGLLLLLVGIAFIGGGVKSVVDKKVVYTRRILLFKGEKVVREGSAAVAGGLGHIASGMFFLYWAYLAFSDKQVNPFWNCALIPAIWCSQMLGIGLGEIIYRKNQSG